MFALTDAYSALAQLLHVQSAGTVSSLFISFIIFKVEYLHAKMASKLEMSPAYLNIFLRYQSLTKIVLMGPLCCGSKFLVLSIHML